jgi:hypothetical protein
MVNRRRLELAKPQECFGNAAGGGLSISLKALLSAWRCWLVICRRGGQQMLIR